MEWAKSLARAERWEEEVLLLREEMRRVLVYLDHKAEWWKVQGSSRKDCEPVLESGLRAYAAKQATVCVRLAEDFAAMWLQGIRDASLPPPKTWPVRYLNVSASAKHIQLRLDRNQLRKRAISSIVTTN